MDFQTLRAFVEVVRQGGFSQAAKVVFTTQSLYSRSVRREELNVQLSIPTFASTANLKHFIFLSPLPQSLSRMMT
jgi:DNA-binding transcriptional LysR family regulator